MKDVTSQAELDLVIDFMSGLGTHVAKDVILTEENNSQFVLLRYEQATKSFGYFPPPD